LNFNANKIRWLTESKVSATDIFCIGSGENLVNNFCIVETEFQFFFSKTYQIYFDDEKQYFATLINNTDLIDRGIDTKGYEYRIVKMFLNILRFL
jgi:hypothetical protein